MEQGCGFLEAYAPDEGSGLTHASAQESTAFRSFERRRGPDVGG